MASEKLTSLRKALVIQLAAGSTAQQRKAALEFCNGLSDLPIEKGWELATTGLQQAIEHGGAMDSGERSMLLHFLLGMVEGFVKGRWEQIAPRGKSVAKLCEDLMLNPLIFHAPNVVRERLAALVVALAKRCWPNKWDFLPPLLSTAPKDQQQMEFTLILLRRLGESLISKHQAIAPSSSGSSSLLLPSSSQTFESPSKHHHSSNSSSSPSSSHLSSSSPLSSSSSSSSSIAITPQLSSGRKMEMHQHLVDQCEDIFQYVLRALEANLRSGCAPALVLGFSVLCDSYACWAPWKLVLNARVVKVLVQAIAEGPPRVKQAAAELVSQVLCRAETSSDRDISNMISSVGEEQRSHVLFLFDHLPALRATLSPPKWQPDRLGFQWRRTLTLLMVQLGSVHLSKFNPQNSLPPAYHPYLQFLLECAQPNILLKCATLPLWLQIVQQPLVQRQRWFPSLCAVLLKGFSAVLKKHRFDAHAATDPLMEEEVGESPPKFDALVSQLRHASLELLSLLVRASPLDQNRAFCTAFLKAAANGSPDLRESCVVAFTGMLKGLSDDGLARFAEFLVPNTLRLLTNPDALPDVRTWLLKLLLSFVPLLQFSLDHFLPFLHGHLVPSLVAPDASPHHASSQKDRTTAALIVLQCFKQFPRAFLPRLSALVDAFKPLLSSQTDVSTQKITLFEAFAHLSSALPSPKDRFNFLRSLLSPSVQAFKSPEVQRFLSISSSSSSPSSSSSSPSSSAPSSPILKCILQNPEKSLGEAGALSRLWHLVEIFSAVSGALSPSSPSPLWPTLAPVLPDVLRLVQHIHALWMPAFRHAVPKGAQALFRVSSVEVQQKLHKFVKNIREASGGPLGLGQTWLTYCRLSCYHFLGNIARACPAEFFGAEQAGKMIAQCVFGADAMKAIEVRHLSQLLNCVVQPLVPACPPDALRRVLGPFFVNFVQSLARRIAAGYQKLLEEGSRNESSVSEDLDEVLDRQFLSSLTSSAVQWLRRALFGVPGKEAVTPLFEHVFQFGPTATSVLELLIVSISFSDRLGMNQAISLARRLLAELEPISNPTLIEIVGGRLLGVLLKVVHQKLQPNDLGEILGLIRLILTSSSNLAQSAWQTFGRSRNQPFSNKEIQQFLAGTEKVQKNLLRKVLKPSKSNLEIKPLDAYHPSSQKSTDVVPNSDLFSPVEHSRLFSERTSR